MAEPPAAKRQRVAAVAPQIAEDASAAPAKNLYNGPCCNGVKLAGTGPGYKLTDAVQINMAKRTRACWVSDDKTKGLVATKCGRCKKIIVPTAEQLQRVQQFKLNSIFEEVQLREAEAATGLPPAEVIALWRD